MIKHLDLGVLEGPLLLFGGVYSNRHALEALSDVADARGIPPAQMICTGDVVAYCGAPERSVSMMRNLACPVVAGNCEVQLARGAADCGCGFEDGSACDLLSVGWYGHANAVLSQEARAWMAGLPDLISFEHAGNRYAVLHGGLTDVARFIWPTTPPEVFAEEWERVEAATGPVDHIIAGHSGIPFVRDLPQGRWINAGVIGMPPHDGLSETRYAILDRGRIEICHLSYDVLAAADEMSGITRLPKGYRDALLTGYWPSEDVLPPELRVPALASG